MVFGLVPTTLNNVDLVVRLLIGVALGAAIGLEREMSDQPAGLRTHISVALGATLFGVISVAGFGEFQAGRNDTNVTMDVTRVASQVVVGIGFLGAGAILKEGLRIRGLTTAASLWVTAAIGLAVGVGSYAAAAIATGALLLSLLGLRRPRTWLRSHFGRRRGLAVIELDRDADIAGIVAEVDDLADVTLRNVTIRRSDDATYVEVELKGERGQELAGLLAKLGRRPDVRDVDID